MARWSLSASNIGWPEEIDREVLGLMGELGYSGLEVAPTRLFPTDPYTKLSEARLLADDVRRVYGLAPCSIQSIWYGKAGSIFDPSDARELLDYTRLACAFAESLGARNLVFGCPRNRTVPDGSSPEDAYPFLAACGDAAAAHGVTLALEANPPMYGTNFMNRTSDVLRVLDDLGHPRGLSINLDIGAMVAQGEQLSAVEGALRWTSHVHVSEPGLAPIVRRALHREVRAVLEDFGYAGYVSLEMARSNTRALRSCLEYVAEVFL